MKALYLFQAVGYECEATTSHTVAWTPLDADAGTSHNDMEVAEVHADAPQAGTRALVYPHRCLASVACKIINFHINGGELTGEIYVKFSFISNLQLS